MCHSLCRVVVVSVVALSLNVMVVPAVQARPHESGKAVKAASKNWIEEATMWLNRVMGKEEGSRQVLKKTVGRSGPCIDPMGNTRPCP